MMMTMRRAVVPLQGLLVVLFALLVMFQVLALPDIFATMAKDSWEDAYLRWPLTIASVFWVLCIEIIVGCTWRLLSLAKMDRIFNDSSWGWVNTILGSIGAAWVGLLIVFLYVGSTATDPGLVLMLFVFLVVASVMGLLMVVMRALLRQAMTLRTDLESVI